MTTILLLLIAVIFPWAVHLAPPRQRLLALVMMVAVLMLFGIFVTNPVTAWAFWAGLVVGIASIAGYSMFLAGRG